jgi:hypothetical protein
MTAVGWQRGGLSPCLGGWKNALLKIDAPIIGITGLFSSTLTRT